MSVGLVYCSVSVLVSDCLWCGKTETEKLGSFGLFRFRYVTAGRATGLGRFGLLGVAWTGLGYGAEGDKGPQGQGGWWFYRWVLGHYRWYLLGKLGLGGHSALLGGLWARSTLRIPAAGPNRDKLEPRLPPKQATREKFGGSALCIGLAGGDAIACILAATAAPVRRSSCPVLPLPSPGSSAPGRLGSILGQV